MARATWNGVVLAETSRPVLLEGNVYFPLEDVRHEYLDRTRAWSVCPWKGLARYYTVRAGGRVNEKRPGTTRTPVRSPARSRTMWRSGTGFRWTLGRSPRFRRRPEGERPCGCEVTVTKGAPADRAGQQNPTCCCGRTMTKVSPETVSAG